MSTLLALSVNHVSNIWSTQIILYTKDQHVVIIVDACEAHLSPSLQRSCVNHNLTLVEFRDRVTSGLQPLDVSEFGLENLNIDRHDTTALFKIDRDAESRWQVAFQSVRASAGVSIAGLLRGWIDKLHF